MSLFTRKRVIIILVCLFFLAAVFGAMGLGLFLISPADKEGGVQLVVVEEGLSLGEVAGKLKEKKIITSKPLFMLWARVMGTSRRIKSGEYRLGSRMAPIKILELLTKGAIVTHAVTIPEGFTKVQIAMLLAEEGLVDKGQFLALTDVSTLLEPYGIKSPSLEGYLYPDTYHFGRGISALTAIDTMIKRFLEVIEPLKKRAKEVGMKMEEVITLASIVEKETGQGKERPLIASVFLNRLKRRMRLESDPTVIYGLDGFDGNLRRKDLKRPTPYNTYVIRGLPPGPIASPGLQAIRAVLYPARTDYLFFVSKNDGTHYFSKTLSEHNRAVEKYQRRRRSRKRKTS